MLISAKDQALGCFTAYPINVVTPTKSVSDDNSQKLVPLYSINSAAVKLKFLC